MTVENKRVIVVGASKGLGRGIAVAFARRGARVLALARGEAGLATLAAEAERPVDVRAGDAADPAFVEAVLAAEDPDAVLVVAGVAPVLAPINAYAWESFSDVWMNDVKATFLWLTGLARKPMRDGGRVVVFSSGAALHGSPLSGGYAPAKQAQRYLCDYMRVELARAQQDITVQCVLPQLTPHTTLGRAGVAAYAARAGEPEELYVKKRFGEVPLSPSIAGEQMLRLLTEDALAGHAELVLAGAGLRPLEKK